jgi:hypothetical protein
MKLGIVRGLLACAIAASLAPAASAGTVIVSSFDSAYTTPGSWYNSDTRPGGSASIVNLTGAGGNLENNQPSPPGAALLTTDLTNGAKASVAISNDYGAASTLANINLSYDYYRTNVAGGTEAAAPSIQLSFYDPNYNPGVTTVPDRGYTTLVYEPYENLPGNPPSGSWQSASIDMNNGLFWTTGGFGQPSGNGGATLKTLADWYTAFFGSSNGAIADAHLISITMNLGTYNPGVTGYFDNVAINGTAIADTTYDFSPNVNAVPEPSTLVSAAGAGLMGLGYALRRRGRKS